MSEYESEGTPRMISEASVKIRLLMIRDLTLCIILSSIHDLSMHYILIFPISIYIGEIALSDVKEYYEMVFA